MFLIPPSLKRAFSLIEMLFAVAIVAIVMSIMVAHLGNLRHDALKRIALGQQASLQQAVDTWVAAASSRQQASADFDNHYNGLVDFLEDSMTGVSIDTATDHITTDSLNKIKDTGGVAAYLTLTWTTNRLTTNPKVVLELPASYND
jgi:prepilin-type N-terminal cleavage/methylation domain-containing protein